MIHNSNLTCDSTMHYLKGPSQRLSLVEKAKQKLFGPDGPLDEALIRPPDHSQKKCSLEPVQRPVLQEETRIAPKKESVSLDLPPADHERKPSLVERMKPKVEHLVCQQVLGSNMSSKFQKNINKIRYSLSM